MNLIRSLSQISKQKNNFQKGTVLTIGNFDGVHLGHIQIINRVKEIAKEKNLNTAILTFEPHTATFFKPQSVNDFRLTSLAQKIKIFKENNIDNAIILPFNKKLASLEAKDFVKQILVDDLNVKYLVIGHDFIFGKDRKGNIEFLKKEAANYDFEVIEISAFEINGEIFSSTLARNLIRQGKIKDANNILSRNFAIEGIVLEGKKLGRTIGFPTLNIKPKSHIIKPRFGVYKTEIYIPHLQQNFATIMNFGLRPTVSQSLEPLYEVHIFDYDESQYGSLYNHKIIIKLQDFVREEKKFASLDELKKQIIIDVQTVKNN